MPPARVILHVLSGPLNGKKYTYDSHDAFVFGRDTDCQASVPGDRSVSRHHFALEILPPAIRIRDLGSLNGTLVNGVKVGGRTAIKEQASEQRRRPALHNVRDGDCITVGSTKIRVQVISAVLCRECGSECEGSENVCQTCRKRTDSTGIWVPASPSVRCVQCNEDVTREASLGEIENYICQRCRRKAQRSSRELRSLVQEQSHHESVKGDSKQLAGYVLEKVLGRGGMGVVYRGRVEKDPSKAVAIKVILTDAATDDKAAKRVLREIGIGLDLVHERIVQVLAHGSVGNLIYVVMELCDAGNLERLLKRYGGKLPLDKSIRLMGMCLEGMEYAHRRKVVHRDIKPANILLYKGSNGKLHPKISDFGLAKTLELAGLSGMTATGTFGGSWYYMPREQMTNFKFVGPVSDVWSIGATFYQVLTGTYAREFPPQKDPVQVVLRDRPVPIRKRDATIPKKLASIIDRALADDPADRFADAGAMRRELAELL
jgi:hypothetical protein